MPADVPHGSGWRWPASWVWRHFRVGAGGNPQPRTPRPIRLLRRPRLNRLRLLPKLARLSRFLLPRSGVCSIPMWRQPVVPAQLSCAKRMRNWSRRSRCRATGSSCKSAVARMVFWWWRLKNRGAGRKQFCRSWKRLLATGHRRRIVRPMGGSVAIQPPRRNRRIATRQLGRSPRPIRSSVAREPPPARSEFPWNQALGMKNEDQAPEPRRRRHHQTGRRNPDR